MRTAATADLQDRLAVVSLDDGRHVILRALDASDGPALVAAIERADPNDLRRRFMGGVPPMSYLLRQLQSADGVHDCDFGAFSDDGRLVGVAQFDRVDDSPSAEFAIEVEHAWQRVGLGTALLRQLTSYARSVGVREFAAHYFADNVPVQRLLRDTGHFVASSYECGEGNGHLDISEST